jgi:hypothetical protein
MIGKTMLLPRRGRLPELLVSGLIAIFKKMQRLKSVLRLIV